MTTPIDDQTTPQQLNETDELSEAEEGWEKPESEPEGQVDAAAEEGKSPEGDKAEEVQDGEKKDAEADAEKPLPAEDHLKAEVKRFRDKYSESKGEGETLRRLAKKLEDEGLLDREELAKDMGIDPAYLNAVLDRKELPEAGEEGHVKQLESRFKEDFHNPVIQRALVKAYGPMDEQVKILAAFDFAVANDAALREKYMNTAPEDVLYFALDEGKAAVSDYEEVQALGNSPTSMLAEIRRLRAENEELRKKPETVVTDENQQQPSQEELPEPKNAREAKLRVFMQ